MERSAGAVFIDILFLILCLRILYISVSRGLLPEIFKITGLISGSFFAFQYYSFVADIINQAVSFLGKEHLYFITFLLILLSVGIVFSLLRLIVTFLFKREEISVGERWVSFCVGGVRAAFLSSIIIFLLYLSPFNSRHLPHTITYKIFKNIAPNTYIVTRKLAKIVNPKFSVNEKIQIYRSSP